MLSHPLFLVPSSESPKGLADHLPGIQGVLPLTCIQRGSPSFNEDETQNTDHPSNEANCI